MVPAGLEVVRMVRPINGMLDRDVRLRRGIRAPELFISAYQAVLREEMSGSHLALDTRRTSLARFFRYVNSHPQAWTNIGRLSASAPR